MTRVWVPLVAALALTACEEEASESVSTETGGEAAGEILGGTISDDMIPLEELTSTSPPAERRANASSGNASTTSDEEAAPETFVAEPTGPVTAGPGQPSPQTQEAGEPQIDPPAF